MNYQTTSSQFISVTIQVKICLQTWMLSRSRWFVRVLWVNCCYILISLIRWHLLLFLSFARVVERVAVGCSFGRRSVYWVWSVEANIVFCLHHWLPVRVHRTTFRSESHKRRVDVFLPPTEKHSSKRIGNRQLEKNA